MFCTNCGNEISAGVGRCPTCGTLAGNAAISPVRATTPPPLTGGSSLSTGSGTGGGSAPLEFGKLVGRVLGGRYQLSDFIGSGGMGEIYRARRTHIGDTVAVKVLRSDVVTNEKSRQRFYREARAAAMLHHPNAVVIHDFGEDSDGLAYIVMELLLGRSLRQVLADEGALDPVRAYGIVRQACAALEAGHRSGIIHRDIKPDNIILLNQDDDTDHVKILDFGIAKLRDKALDTLSVENNLTNVGTVIGTPNYMSPEQCQGEEADARSDIYSLGVVMYEILTGVMPFVAKTPTGVAIKHVTEKPRPLRELRSDLPAEVEAVVLQALEKTPEARPQSMLELARKFAGALKQAGVTMGLGRTGQVGGQKVVPIETPRTDEVQGTIRTLMMPGVDTGSSDTFQTKIQAAGELANEATGKITNPPVTGNTPVQRLTEVLPNSSHDDFQTVITDALPEAVAGTSTPPSFDTVLTDEPLTSPPATKDPFATVLPAGADDFRTVVTETPAPTIEKPGTKPTSAAPAAEPQRRDAYATMVPTPPGEPQPRDAYATMIPTGSLPGTESSAAGTTNPATVYLPPPADAVPPVATPAAKPVVPAPAKKDKGGKNKKAPPTTKTSGAAASASPVIELSTELYAEAVTAPPPKSGSQKVVLIGIAAVVLAVALGVWAFLTKDNQPPPVVDKPAPTVTPASNAAATSANAPTPPVGMVYVPGGEFKVGNEEGADNEKPAHSVILAPFFIDQTEVTNEQYAKFLEATGYVRPPAWKGQRYAAGTDKLPVTDVTWEDANEYAKWAGKRLPTEEEWELAARGTDGRLYPWGSGWQDDVANVAKDEADKRNLAPVGTYLRGQSFYGVLDMIGNAWEWTASDYKAYVGGQPVEIPPGYQNLKVLRGGSYASAGGKTTATLRRGWPATRKDWPESSAVNYSQTGFRLAQDAPQR